MEKKKNKYRKRRSESDKQTCQKEQKLGPLFYFSSSAKVFMLKANQSAKQRCGQAIFFPSVLLITRLLTIRFFPFFHSFFVLLKHFILFFFTTCLFYLSSFRRVLLRFFVFFIWPLIFSSSLSLYLCLFLPSYHGFDQILF